VIPAGNGQQLPAFGSGLVRATLGIEAGVGEDEALDGTAVKKMLADNLRDVFHMDEAVPDSLRVDHHNRAVLALVKTATFVRADFAFQTGVLNRVLESAFQLPAAFAGTARARGVFVPLVGADEEVMLELCHCSGFLPVGRRAAHTGF